MKHPSANPLKLRAARSYRLYSRILLGAILCASANLSSGATVSIGVQHWPLADPDMPVPSNSDLVNAGSPDLLYFNSTSFVSPLNVFDGTVENLALISESEDEFPAIITFSLDVIANPLGYTISSIRTLSATITAFPGVYDTRMQYYKLEYSLVGDTDFETLLTVDLRDSEPVGFDWNEGFTWVTLLDIEDELTGVDMLKFTWLDPSAITSSGSIIAEIDIEGTPITQVPEPGAGVLLAAAGLCLLRARSR